MKENSFEKIEINPAQLAIEKAKSEALSLEELEAIKDQLDSTLNDFIQSRITLEQYERLEENLASYPGVIKMGSAQMFEEYLRAAKLDEATVNELVEHEEDHFREIEKAGLKPTYRIEFAKNVGEKFSMYPAVSFDFPDDIEDEEARTLLRRIISAPSELSERDKRQLGG